MKCPNCNFENLPNARFCQNCGNKLAVTCPNCSTENTPEAKFCLQCGYSLVDARIAPAKPAPITGETVHEAERKIVTILFGDIKGSSAVAEQLDPEDWGDIVQETLRIMIEAVERYGGTIGRLMGDGILAFFGAPVAHEDDPLRAVRSALDILDNLKPYQQQVRQQLAQRRLQVSEADLMVRIGLNTGLVLVGEVGTDTSQEYTALGDAINLAARMEQTAQPGTIQATEDTFRLVADLVEAETLGEIEVKGKRRPVATYQLLRLKKEASTAQKQAGWTSPLVGREGEFKQLLSALEDLLHKGGHIVCLVGEAGLGKSRLIAELEQDGHFKSEFEWTSATAVSYESERSFGLFKKLFQSSAGVTGDESLESIQDRKKALLLGVAEENRMRVEHALGVLFGSNGTGGMGYFSESEFKQELFEGVRLFWKERAATKPLVLVFDDIHWADEASLELLMHLFSLTEKNVVLICAFRPDRSSPAWKIKQTAEQDFPHRYLEISLGNLDERQSELLIQNLLGAKRLPDDLTSVIRSKAEGNPLFVEEIVQELVDQHIMIPDGSGWKLAKNVREIDLPKNLSSLLAARIDRLPAEVRRTLYLAAVIGRTFSYRILKMIVDQPDQLDQHLFVLQQTGLVQVLNHDPEVIYSFRHTLIQEVAYQAILHRQRRSFHRQVGEIIESLYADRLEEYAPTLANHFDEGEEWEKALVHYCAAGERASRMFANREALVYLNRALTIGALLERQDERLVKLYLCRGGVYETLGFFQESRLDFENALEFARKQGDRQIQWQALLDLGKLWASRDYRETGVYFHQALELARSTEEPQMVARSLNRLGNWYVNQDRASEGLVYHLEAKSIFEDLNDQHGLASTLDLIGLTNFNIGNIEEGIKNYDTSVELFRQLEDLPGLASTLTLSSMFIRNYQKNLNYGFYELSDRPHHFDEARQICRSIGWRSGEAFLSWAYGQYLGASGQYVEAIQQAQMGLEIAEEIEHHQWITGAHFSLGMIFKDILALEKAQMHLEKATKLAQQVNSMMWFKTSLGQLAGLYAETGQTQKAHQILEDHWKNNAQSLSTASRVCVWAQAVLALALEKPDEALRLADLLIETDPYLPEGEVIPLVWDLRSNALAALGRLDEAEVIQKYAAQKAETYKDLPQTWRLLAGLARHQRRLGKSGDAQEACDRAKQIIVGLAEKIPEGDFQQNFLDRAERLLTD